MLIGDIFAKLGRGETLAPAEIDFLRREMNTVQHSSSLVQRWTGTGGDPDFPFMRATRGQFDFPPLETARWRRTTLQSIPNSTWTEVEFDEQTWNNTGWISWDSGTPGSFTHPSVQGPQRAYLMLGGAIWATNATGERRISFNRDGDESFVILDVNDANASGEQDTNVINFPYRITNVAATGWSIDVHQNSGGALDLVAVHYALIRLL